VLSQSSIGETALDMPHLDDILRSSAKTMSSADAAAGGSSMGGGSRRSFTSQSDNRRVSSSTSMLNSNNKSAAIIIEDDESNISWGSTGSRQELSSALRKSETSLKTLEFISNSEQILENELLHSNRPPSKPTTQASSQRDRRSSLDNKLTAFDSISSARSLNLGTKQQNKRGLWVFESLWGSQDHEEREDDETSIGESGFGVSLGGSSDEDDENKSMRLIRTISGRVGFSRSNVSFRGNGMQRQHSTYYDTGYKRKCRSFLGEHIKLTASCLLVLVVMAITIGMESEERSESGELGGLAYSVEENTKVNTWAGEVVVNRSGGGDGKEQVDEKAVNEDNDDVGAAQTSKVPSTTTNEEPQKDEPEVPVVATNRADFFMPPPYDLQNICSSSSISQSDGYDMCIAACLPSRCCLISEEYKVWTIPETWRLQLLYPGVETMGQVDKKEAVIGDIISSCLLEQPDLCREYKNQCSILPLAVLLPLKPPSKDAAANMNAKKGLELAEYINHSCKKSSKTIEGDNECQLLCQEKACCFADNEKETKAFLPHTEVVSITTVPNSDNIDEPQDEVKQVALDRQPTNTTTESTQASLPLNGTESELSNSTLRHLQQKNVKAPVNIPEDGKGVTSVEFSPLPEKESSVNTAMAKSSQEESVVELSSCVNDPLEHCTIYAGCLPLFTKEN